MQRMTFGKSSLQVSQKHLTENLVLNLPISFLVVCNNLCLFLCDLSIFVYSHLSPKSISLCLLVLKEPNRFPLSASHLYQNPQMYDIKHLFFQVSSWRLRIHLCVCIYIHSHRSRYVATYMCKAVNPLLGYSDTSPMTACNLQTEDDKVSII